MRGLAEISRNAGRWADPGSCGSESRPRLHPATPTAPSVQGIGRNWTWPMAGAQEIDDVTTCPGAYSCNLGHHQSDESGRGAGRRGPRSSRSPGAANFKSRSADARIPAASTGSAILGFYGNARKIGGKEVPYYQMLLGGGYDNAGIMRFGVAIQSIPARLAPTGRTASARALCSEPAGRGNFPRLRTTPQSGDISSHDERFGQAGRDVSGDVSGLGRRGGVFPSAWPRRMRQLSVRGAGPAVKCVGRPKTPCATQPICSTQPMM